ncbi:MAG TPA: hypothetical protein VF450_14570 [Noviherbaspirillum sp.]
MLCLIRDFYVRISPTSLALWAFFFCAPQHSFGMRQCLLAEHGSRFILAAFFNDEVHHHRRDDADNTKQDHELDDGQPCLPPSAREFHNASTCVCQRSPAAVDPGFTSARWAACRLLVSDFAWCTPYSSDGAETHAESMPAAIAEIRYFMVFPRKLIEPFEHSAAACELVDGDRAGGHALIFINGTFSMQINYIGCVLAGYPQP